MVKKCLDAKNIHNIAVLVGCENVHLSAGVVDAGYLPAYDKVITGDVLAKLLMYYDKGKFL